MAVESQESHAPASPIASSSVRGLLAGGTTGNELLTTVTGAVLLVVLSTVVVMGSRVALLFAGQGSRATLFPIHKDSFHHH
jgi:hypothetical protein